MKEFLLDFIKNGLTSLDDNVKNAAAILSEDFWKNGNTWYDFAHIISQIIMPVALSIISICFMIEFIKIIMDANIMKWQFGLKLVTKFVLAKVCIDVSFYVLGAIYITAAEWVGKINVGTMDIGATAWSLIEPQVQGYKFLDALGLAVSLGIVFTSIWGISLIVQVIAYARKFELIVYLCIAPLACAFLPLEDAGGSRITKKYFLSFASVCLQGVFMMISIKLYGILCVEELSKTLSSNQNVASIAGQLLIASLVLVLAIVKSSSWARSIFDAA